VDRSNESASRYLRGGRRRVRRRRITGSQIPLRSAGGRAQRHDTCTPEGRIWRRRRGRRLRLGRGACYLDLFVWWSPSTMGWPSGLLGLHDPNNEPEGPHHNTQNGNEGPCLARTRRRATSLDGTLILRCVFFSCNPHFVI
jgi:hypothetical protein